MTIYIDEEKIFHKIQYLFIIKISNISKFGTEGKFLILIKDIYKKHTTNIILYNKIFPRVLGKFKNIQFQHFHLMSCMQS